MLKILTSCIGLLLLFVPQFAFAANTHHYVCADFSSLASATCTGSTLTITDTGSGAFAQDTSVFSMAPGTWFVSLTVTSYTTGTGYVRQHPLGAGTERDFTSVTLTDASFTAANTAFIGLGSTGGGTPYQGSVTNICITDTIGGCAVVAVPLPFVRQIISLLGSW